MLIEYAYKISGLKKMSGVKNSFPNKVVISSYFLNVACHVFQWYSLWETKTTWRHGASIGGWLFNRDWLKIVGI